MVLNSTCKVFKLKNVMSLKRGNIYPLPMHFRFTFFNGPKSLNIIRQGRNFIK